MKKLFALVLLLSSAMALSCQEKIDNGVASTEANYTFGKYEFHARLGEVYKNGADCFSEAADSERAEFYYTLAGDNYTQAALLLEQDFQTKSRLLYSAGECYQLAGLNALAIESFGATVDLHEQHPTQVDLNLSQSAQEKIRQLSLLNESTFQKPENIPQQMDMLYIAVLAVAAVAIISVVAYTQGRRL